MTPKETPTALARHGRHALPTPARRSAVMALFSLLSLAFSAVHAAPVDVRDLRLSADADGTRVVLEMSRAVEHTVFSLRNPDRIVIDLAATALRCAVPAGQGLVRQVRCGDREDGSLRVVLDLSERVQARSLVIPPGDGHGYRLVVNLGNPGELKPVQAQHAPRNDLRDLVIAIDAGHGGKDPGAIGRAGTREKDVTLAISRMLARRIDRQPGMRAVLIRDADEFVSLRGRRDKARAHNADLFVSVHADAIRDRNVSGSSVYILSTGRASSEAARWLAERENAADLVGGVKLDDKDDMLASVLLDLSQTATLIASLDAAEQVLRELHRIGEVRKPQIQQAGFAVLTSPDVPSMLVETAYISNPTEERRLRDARHQQRLAEGIYDGIHAFFFNNPPPGTLFADMRAKKRIAAGGAP
jgi:N-acetylmuramoyl-L-alanine amidase